MKIVLVSRSWPKVEMSGVSLIAYQHCFLLKKLGHEVVVIGTNILEKEIKADKTYRIKSEGSDALYAKKYVDKKKLQSILTCEKPDAVLLEAWQTSLTEAALEIAHELQIPTLMISHGISVHAFTWRPRDLIRAAGWFMYRIKKLPQLVSKLTVLSTLDYHTECPRFYDRDIAIKMGKKITLIPNSAIHEAKDLIPYESRTKNIISIGYFSEIKNQKFAINLLYSLPSEYSLTLIGKRQGKYYRKCLSLVRSLNLTHRVRFLEDSECDIAEEVSKSILSICTSITEVLPVTILESMAAGTPFVSFNVGAVPTLEGGIIAATRNEFLSATQNILTNEAHWNELSTRARTHYRTFFHLENVEKAIQKSLELTITHA
ncbi:glycosyltransferase family 4 protein [Limnobacter litoralis]|uniref:Glycosyl transferase family 1 domain-containing protein n=1 Tax=Limnobacter litoralis TaxID=481366 RepID=A0ABQ5YSZ8_9BURK|nr:glycosyltransferase family 4 protein [Limnobacter litoralis]GLR27016.1 hypothetical protein GCM10007875_21070 [Limnobacter litoralis]